MADTMQFDLVSPERSLASLRVSEVQIPAADGDMTAMPDHAPTITSLRPGLLKISGPDGTSEYVVTGGFAEISTEGTSVLAERAIPRDDVTQDDMNNLISEARKAQENANPDTVDAATKLLADMVAIGDEIGISTT
ncbi:F0F1 ATP synthase subunit epsilon [Parasulfitobacter algicola]|uniref:ATP synthase epsilon chain n=1 Tax=Parasulfitobacter algicola TaxID=2614809 RepID=A0ABX2ISQ8_9RHOB|nr:F0F1 ATP synthase subunit epsilon [Sulfitobacter algicola]NSX55939.1 F0F1 ATP synthase subunit epsilon [Sulfitobacter algicola]